MPDWTAPRYNNKLTSFYHLKQTWTVFLSKPTYNGNKNATVVLEVEIKSDEFL